MQEAGESIRLNPTPGYVVKTRILKSDSVQVGTKVFLNVCQDSQVPKPEQDFEPGIVFPLIVDNKWEIPIIVSREKEVKDKQGLTSYCYDCCINEMCFRWCTINSDLRSILNEWCIEAVELLYTVTLDRQYSTPKMLNKGPLSETVIRKDELTDQGFLKKLSELKQNESLGLLEELHQDPEEPADIEIFSNSSKPFKRPLIEEIDLKPTAQVTSSGPKPLSKPVPTEISYCVSFQKLAQNNPYSLIVSYESNLPYQFLQVDYQSPNLIISSKSDGYVFDTYTKRAELRIPLPHTPVSFKSFYLHSQTLVFC